MKPEEFASFLKAEDARAATGLTKHSIEVAGKEFDISPEALVFLDDTWKKACIHYDLEEFGNHKAFGQLALLAGGAQIAREQRKPIIGDREIVEGWNQLWVCGVNIPPHECMGLSILDKVPEILVREGFAFDILREAVQKNAKDMLVDVDEKPTLYL